MTPATLAPPTTTALSVVDLKGSAVARAVEEFGFDHETATDVIQFMFDNGVEADARPDKQVIVDCMPGDALYEAFDMVAVHDGIAVSGSTHAVVQNALSAKLGRPVRILHAQVPIGGRVECVQRTISVKDDLAA